LVIALFWWEWKRYCRQPGEKMIYIICPGKQSGCLFRMIHFLKRHLQFQSIGRISCVFNSGSALVDAIGTADKSIRSKACEGIRLSALASSLDGSTHLLSGHKIMIPSP
jgi:hypothetical protein